MSFTQDFFTSRNNSADGSTRIGQQDRLWYDPITNTIRVSDGTTPGGIIVSGGGGGSISVSDEGTILTSTATSLNFQGNAVTATAAGSNVTVKISDNFLVFDGGYPSIDFSQAPSFDAGGVT